MSNIFLSTRFFRLCAGIVLGFCLSFFMPFLLVPMKVLLMVFLLLCLIDLVFVFRHRQYLSAARSTAQIWSMGDDNKVEILIRNQSRYSWHIELIDEVPFQFQLRNFNRTLKIEGKGNERVLYHLKPLQRGLYQFGYIQLLYSSRLNLVQYRRRCGDEREVKVYPSFIQMKQYELYSVSKIAQWHGIKKMRRIGLSYEFEQIKTYVRGDDVRQINWKASGRHQQLMTNQFEDEKSQPVYSIIDKSRNMLMPFQGMSLMDYAINTTLSISNIVLKKQDKAGLITFSDKFGGVVKADRKQGQLKAISEALYQQKERDLEANYELLYQGIRRMISTRSLIFLYTSFETQNSIKRVLPVLQKIQQQHLLVVVFFKNEGLTEIAHQKVRNIQDVYTSILAEQTANEQHAIVQTLRAAGIQSILSKPEYLSVNTINKYLELKSRTLI